MNATTLEASIQQVNESTLRAVLAVRDSARPSSSLWMGYRVWRRTRSTLQLVRELRDDVVHRLPRLIAAETEPIIEALYAAVLETERRQAHYLAVLRAEVSRLPFGSAAVAAASEAQEVLHEVSDLMENMLLSLPSRQAAHLHELEALRTGESTSRSWRDELADCLQD